MPTFNRIFTKKPRIIIDYQNEHTRNLETIRIQGDYT